MGEHATTKSFKVNQPTASSAFSLNPSISAARNKGSICEGRTEVKYEASYRVVSWSSSPPLRWSEKDVSVGDTLQLNLCSFPWTKAKGRKGKPRSHQRYSPANRRGAVHRQETTRCDGQRRIRVGNELSIHILSRTQQASFPMSSTFGLGIRVPVNIFVVMLVTESTSSSISRLMTAEEQPTRAVFAAAFPTGRRGSPRSTAASTTEARTRPRQGNEMPLR